MLAAALNFAAVPHPCQPCRWMFFFARSRSAAPRRSSHPVGHVDCYWEFRRSKPGGITRPGRNSAKHSGMPRKAVYRFVDYVLPPEGLAIELARTSSIHDQATAGQGTRANETDRSVLTLLRKRPAWISRITDQYILRRIPGAGRVTKLSARPFLSYLKANPGSVEQLSQIF